MKIIAYGNITPLICRCNYCNAKLEFTESDICYPGGFIEGRNNTSGIFCPVCNRF